MTVLTRTGYLVDAGPFQEIKKELTVRPIVNGDYGFPPPPFKVYRTTKNGIAFQDSTELLNLGKPFKIRDRNQPESEPGSQDSSETQHIKTRHSQQQFRQAMASFLYHVATGRRRYPWL